MSQFDNSAGRQWLRVVMVVTMLGTIGPAAALAQQAGDGSDRGLIREVTPSQVKRFLDPTRMISKISYDYQMNFLPAGVDLMTHRLRPWVALNHSNAIWLEVPYLDFSIPNRDGPSGMGDLVAGWGFVLHEDLSSRLTTVAGAVEFLLPTGDREQGTGFDTYAFSPAALVALNPTDVFPVYLIGRYLQSFASTAETGDGTGDSEPKVRTVELSVQTFHILPTGFFLAVLPTFVIDLNNEFNIFSLGLGIGRALNRRLALQAGYVQYVAGRQTFNRAFTVGITYLWGTDLAR